MPSTAAGRQRHARRRLLAASGGRLPRTGLVSSALTGLFVFASAVLACSLPVFRYALENWEPDKYELVVFHRGRLRPEHQAAVNALSQRSANLKLLTVDVDAGPPAEPDEEPGRLPAPREESRLPWAVLRYPQSFGADAALWEGPLEEMEPSTLLDSPARRTAGRRILEGNCAVWVFLESGDAGKDEPAAQLLRAELARLEKALKLPEIDPDEARALSGGGSPELRVAFSMLRIGREGREEAALRKMLLRSEKGLRELDEPMAFPVFGRGHVLYALVGAGINERNVAEACEFLVGPCSCVAKERNPGVDLLMSVDWDGVIAGRLGVDAHLPPLVGLPSSEGPAASANEAGPTGDGDPEYSDNAASGVALRNGVVALVVGVAVVLAGTIVLWWRKPAGQRRR